MADQERQPREFSRRDQTRQDLIRDYEGFLDSSVTDALWQAAKENRPLSGNELHELVKGALMPSESMFEMALMDSIDRLTGRGLVRTGAGRELTVELTDKAKEDFAAIEKGGDVGEPWPYDYEA